MIKILNLPQFWGNFGFSNLIQIKTSTYEIVKSPFLVHENLHTRCFGTDMWRGAFKMAAGVNKIVVATLINKIEREKRCNF